MAASRGTLNGPDWKDIASALAAYEKEAHTTVRIEVVSAGSADRPDLRISAVQGNGVEEDGVAMRWASTSVLCSKERFKSLEAVVLFLLYQLDFLSVSDENDEADKTA